MNADNSFSKKPGYRAFICDSSAVAFKKLSRFVHRQNPIASWRGLGVFCLGGRFVEALFS